MQYCLPEIFINPELWRLILNMNYTVKRVYWKMIRTKIKNYILECFSNETLLSIRVVKLKLPLVTVVFAMCNHGNTS